MSTTATAAEADEGYESVFNLEAAEMDDGSDGIFNSKTFSDRVLRIEVVGCDDYAQESGAAAGGSGADRKRRREEDKDDDEEGIDSSYTVLGTPVLRVKTIYVSSAVLAVKSNFFLKLFSNGMKESSQSQATVRIANSEENAFMELLRFMYRGNLPTSEPNLLIDILMAADKFEVVSCMELCAQRLMGLPMTLESAVLCLDLPSSVSMTDDLAEAAKKFLAERYKKFPSTELQGEMMAIPLTGIVAILSRSSLGFASEEAAYDIVLRWADLHYPNSEERRNILGSRLLSLVTLMRGMDKVTIIDQPHYRFYFSVHRNRCSKFFPSGAKYHDKFSFAGHVFSLSAHCNMDSSNCFGLLLMILDDKGPVKGTIEYRFEARTRPSQEYVTRYECTSTDSREAIVCKDLFGIPWSEFIADDSPFFFDNKLHLRVHLKITQNPL